MTAISRIRTGWSFAAPGLSLLVVMMGFPVVYAFLMALSSMTLRQFQLSPFKGLGNFVNLFEAPLFWQATFLTMRYAVITVAGEFIIGLAIALMLQKVLRWRAVYFSILTIPMAISPIAVALIWRMLLQPNLGIVNEALKGIGFGTVDWLGDPGLALMSMAMVDIWQQTSFVVLILAAGIASLPREPYEAAEVDGANSWQQFYYITLPMLRPVAAIAVIIQLINEFRTYDLPYILTRGGPGNATDVLSYYAYRRAFLGLSLNEGAAASWILLLIVLCLTILFFNAIERRVR